jgi:hypothetical protein
MADGLVEIRDLLKEVRDLLLPIADAYKAQYTQREEIRALLSTESRKKAWVMADGTRTQRELAKESGMDEGNASRFFKSLRELRAITDAPNPQRAVEV